MKLIQFLRSKIKTIALVFLSLFVFGVMHALCLPREQEFVGKLALFVGGLVGFTLSLREKRTELLRRQGDITVRTAFVFVFVFMSYAFITVTTQFIPSDSLKFFLDKVLGGVTTNGCGIVAGSIVSHVIQLMSKNSRK